jgi:predicted O-linked N-acetylglucosamine transferase (SPINDLY family)
MDIVSDPIIADQEKQYILKNYKNIVNEANKMIEMSIKATDYNKIQNYRLKAIALLSKFTSCLEITDYLLIDANPDIPTDVYIQSHFVLGTLYKTFMETEIQSNRIHHNYEDIFRKGINCFRNILAVKFEDDTSTMQIVSIYTYLCYLAQGNLEKCLQFLQEALIFGSTDPTIHYNLGHVYQKLNKLELSLIHYKIGFDCIDNRKKKGSETQQEQHRLKLNILNGISCIYRCIKQWPQALYYLQKAEKIDKSDPDIQNQLGIVYTEMRRTDLAEISYNKAIQNYTRAFISNDPKTLLSDIYLNFGHMHSYNGDTTKSVQMYNKSLEISPKFLLPFQNKLMNLNYLFDDLEDKMYLYKQHLLTNKLYNKNNGGNYIFDKNFYNTPKINIGIVSGDFVDHPVSYFISTFLSNFNSEVFNVTCYSECIINTGLFSKNLRFKTIANMPQKTAADLIYNDRIHILIDLAGHTASNRLDIFALKPSPIQITYVGYPYSTGLKEMDYRITDAICDNNEISQPFYSERLLYLENCFLCYDPDVSNNGKISNIDISNVTVPFTQNKFITFGCFNRLNKMTDSVISLFNDILKRFKNAKFVFKTKALLNKTIKNKFLEKFDKHVRSRIVILDCTITHDSHLHTYNSIDIAIDTFPYSGTTTSCEALYMGVPVFTLYDSQYYFHAQNVTSSILKNSDLDYYVLTNKNQLFDKIQDLQTRDLSFWKNLKIDTRSRFLNGKVCDKALYMNNLTNMLQKLFNENKENAI